MMQIPKVLPASISDFGCTGYNCWCVHLLLFLILMMLKGLWCFNLCTQSRPAKVSHEHPSSSWKTLLGSQRELRSVCWLSRNHHRLRHVTARGERFPGPRTNQVSAPSQNLGRNDPFFAQFTLAITMGLSSEFALH